MYQRKRQHWCACSAVPELDLAMDDLWGGARGKWAARDMIMLRKAKDGTSPSLADLPQTPTNSVSVDGGATTSASSAAALHQIPPLFQENSAAHHRTRSRSRSHNVFRQQPRPAKGWPGTLGPGSNSRAATPQAAQPPVVASTLSGHYQALWSSDAMGTRAAMRTLLRLDSFVHILALIANPISSVLCFRRCIGYFIRNIV